MKTLYFIPIIIFLSCNSTTSHSEIVESSNNIKDISKDTITFGNITNPLHNKIYRNVDELLGIKYEGTPSGAMIQGNNIRKDKEFGISHITLDKRNIITFEEIIRENGNPKPKYLVLDTINVDNLNKSEFITYCNCRRDSIDDSEIIALVEFEEDTEYYHKIIKAWRADTKTGKITIIKNTKGINCINEGYGAE
ncbi:MAG: hypothetical protein JNM51_05615 [Bacteroidia bacterium]|nr:hypothetical protein [Bacteroidia bacterium]